MAEVVPFAEVVRARRRARERERTEECIRIVEASMHLTLDLFSMATMEERPLRARQLRQLAEVLEYMVAS